MCRATPCATCGKTTWAGCGQHVDTVMSRVPAGQRCTCDRSHPATTTTLVHPELSRRPDGRLPEHQTKKRFG